MSDFFTEQVQAQKADPVYMVSYGDLKEHYQDKYGQRGWIGAMAQAVSGSENRSKSNKAYSAARRTIERHESGQYKNLSKQYESKVSGIGRHLPPDHYTPKSSTITVHVKGHHGDNGRERSWSRTFSGVDAYGFVNNPTLADILIGKDGNDYPPDVIASLESGTYAIAIDSVS